MFNRFSWLAKALVLFLLLASLTGRITEVKQIGKVAAQAPTWDQSSLTFSAGCTSDNCLNTISAEVCNTGSQDMDDTTTYEVWYAVTGNPKDGAVVSSGNISALTSGQCTTLTYNTGGILGSYKFHVFQRPGHPGAGDLWSDTCTVNQCVISSATPTPTPTPTPTGTPDPGASPTPTPPPTGGPSPTATSIASAAPSAGGTTSGTGGTSNNGCRTSLANDRLQCDQTSFDAVMDIFDNNQAKKDILVRFSYNGTSREARTNDDGRAKVAFDFNGNGTVVADPDQCDTQSMNITMPSCPNTNAVTTTGGSQGQVLGASTMADTGVAEQQLAWLVTLSGLSLALLSGLGYAYAIRQA